MSAGHRRYDGTKSPPAEHRFKVTSVRCWLPAGPTDSGGFRKKALVQFIAYKGGLRTVAVDDIIDIK